MNKAHERPACGIRRMPNAHQRLPGPQDLPQQHATPRNFMGWNSAFPSFPTGNPSPSPNTKEKPCIRWHICMSYAGIWKK